MRIVGDIHGKIIQYLDVIEGADESIQIGDFGMGFLTPYQMTRAKESQEEGKHRFIRGNHDDPALCHSMPGWIEDGHYDAKRDMMFVGGAWSIDGDYRRAHDARFGTTSWWEDEELSSRELFRIHNKYVKNKPKIMITHDAPMEAAKKMFFDTEYRHILCPQEHTRTADALQEMFYVHKPDVWIFGHWHISARTVIDGTEFICLAELEHLDI